MSEEITREESEEKEKNLLDQGALLLAPHIMLNDLAKKFIFLQMFTKPEYERFHIALIGSAASGKSELLLDVCRLHPVSIYASAQTSAVGLFGYATRNGIMGGAIRRARGGIVALDDIDKMGKDTRNAMLEILQEGKATITKWGQTWVLKIKANFLIAGNPSSGRWLGGPNFTQIGFDEPFQTRFHCIIPFNDIPPEMYELLGRSFDIKERLREREKERIKRMNTYIEKIRGIEIIRIESDIINRISQFVGELKDKYDTLAPSITPRQVEGTISIVKAHARLNMRDHCIMKDFNEIERLYKQLYKMWLSGF